MADDLQFVGDANDAREENFLARVRVALGLPSDTELVLRNASVGVQGDHALEYAVKLAVELAGAEFGIADGVYVEEETRASLRFDARGALVLAQSKPIDERHLRLVKDQVRKLAASNQIAPANDSSVAPGKPWQVQIDAQGRKRLKRAFIA